MGDEQFAECLDDVGCLKLSRDTDCQALTAELVNEQHPKRLSIMRAIRDEVIRPDMVGSLRP